MLWLALLSYVGAVFTKLVVRNEDEIYLEDGSMDAQRIFAEADVINSTIRQSEHCSFVDEELKYFEYFIVDEEGTEERNIIEAQIPIDNIIDSRQVTNIHEPWITGHIILRPYLNCFEQDDQFLISTLKKDFLKPPPPTTTPYNFTKTENWDLLPGQYGQPIYLDRVIFKEQVKNGFFIEAGADDFEQDSNTILFEMKHGWTGLLVEPNPTIFPKGFLRHRKAWASSSCLATETRPHIVNFAQRLFEGGMAAISPERTEETYQMQCMPLYSLLMAAAGNITVNYLSLDIEGAEFLVLRTIPWDKVDIEVVTVETNHAGEVFPGTKEEIREYMAEQGYVYHNTVAVDDVFVRKDLYEGKYSPDLEMKKWFDKKMDIDEIIKELKETNIIKDVIDIQSEKDEL